MKWMIGFIIVSAGIYFGWQWLDGHMSQQAWAVFNPESSSYELRADGWPVLWKTWHFFIPAALLCGAVFGLAGLAWGKLATENDHAEDNKQLKQRIERLKGNIETERSKTASAYDEAKIAVKAEMTADFEQLERERQDLAKQQAWLNDRHQSHDEREAKLVDAESRIENEIAFFKREFEQRALAAEHRAIEAEQEAQKQYNKHIQSQRLKARYEKRYKHANRQLNELRDAS